MKTSMYFGPFGGQYVPETLVPALDELEDAYLKSTTDPTFDAELLPLLRDYVGRPSALTFASRITEALGGAKVYLKREDLNHTGAHKINNALGQILLARRMGKRRIIAETGAGMHGVAAATAAALFGLECVVYMGEEDIRRQAPNVARMKLLGADALLLIAAALEPERLAGLLALTRSLGMEAIVEVHDEAELLAVLETDAAIIGVNNRNLDDFTVDLRTTERLKSALVRREPRGTRIVVAESGVTDEADAGRLADAGVDAILVGEALMRAPDPAAMIRSFRKKGGVRAA